MKPITKAHSIAFAISTAVVYDIWDRFASIQTDYVIIKLLVSFAMSLTFYKWVFHLLLSLCERTPALKKRILGKYFLEGLWIGFYTVDDEVEYYYEFFEQTLDRIVIKGIVFDADRKRIGEWIIVNPTINLEESKLTYYYEMNITSANDITIGHSRATLFWDKKGYADKLVGFSIDNFSKEKQEYITTKVKNAENPQTWVDSNFWTAVEELHHNEIN